MLYYRSSVTWKVLLYFNKPKLAPTQSIIGAVQQNVCHFTTVLYYIWHILDIYSALVILHIHDVSLTILALALNGVESCTDA